VDTGYPPLDSNQRPCQSKALKTWNQLGLLLPLVLQPVLPPLVLQPVLPPLVQQPVLPTFVLQPVLPPLVLPVVLPPLGANWHAVSCDSGRTQRLGVDRFLIQ
jgi:hypothetical protein